MTTSYLGSMAARSKNHRQSSQYAAPESQPSSAFSLSVEAVAHLDPVDF